MNTSDALHLMVKTFPGGREVVAMRIGKNDETLRKELSGKDPKFKLGDTTAQLISELCIEEQSPNCYAYVNAVNAMAGVVLQLPAPEGEPNEATLMTCTVGLVTGASKVLADITAARMDGQISDNERKQIEAHAHEVIRDMHALLREVARENKAGKPPQAQS